jgi:hypothetical protein
MTHNHQSLLELALDSPSSDDDEELIISTSQILYTHYQTMNTRKHGGSVLDIELFVVKENQIIKNYSKITSRIIQCMVLSILDKGS